MDALDVAEAVQVSSDRVLYRIVAELDRGSHTFGAATTRRTTANRPDRPFTASIEMRPGQQVHIDTNTLDIMCRYADGVTRRAELTIAVDVATRSIVAGSSRRAPKRSTRSRCWPGWWWPDPLRPGWPESLMFAHSTSPYERLLSIDARFEQAAARTVILPDTIVCDRGSVYMAEEFRRASETQPVSFVAEAEFQQHAPRSNPGPFLRAVGQSRLDEPLAVSAAQLPAESASPRPVVVRRLPVMKRTYCRSGSGRDWVCPPAGNVR